MPVLAKGVIIRGFGLGKLGFAKFTSLVHVRLVNVRLREPVNKPLVYGIVYERRLNKPVYVNFAKSVHLAKRLRKFAKVYESLRNVTKVYESLRKLAKSLRKVYEVCKLGYRLVL